MADRPDAAADEKPKAGLSMKDAVSLTFSALALMISAASYYVANVRVQDSVVARVTDHGVEAAGPEDHTTGYRKGFVTLKVAFINSGNRQAIIDTPVYQLSGRPDLRKGAFGGEAGAPAGAFPFILPPKEMRLVPLRIPISDLLDNLAAGEPVRGVQPGADHRRFYAGLVYKSVDSAGRSQATWSGALVNVTGSAQGWIGMGPTQDPGSPSPATQLFPPSRRFLPDSPTPGGPPDRGSVGDGAG